MDSSPKHRKRHWYTAATIGLIGATGLAAMGVVQATAPRSGQPARADVSSASERLLSRPGFGGGGEEETPASKDGVKDGVKYGETIEVPCDPDELIQALLDANSEGGATLELARHCTYELTAALDGDGLPEIAQPVKIKGNGAQIIRAATTPESFRIFHVVAGGDLKLIDLAVKYGDASDGDGGGGILVDDGGRATTEHTTFAYNRSTDEGGAIANYGITKIYGDLHHKDGVKDGIKDGVEDEPETMSGEEADGSTDAEENNVEDTWAEEESAESTHGKDAEGGKDGVESDAKTGIHDNTAVTGGGVYNAGYLSLKDTRVSYNVTTSGNGAGVENVGTAYLVNNRIDNNGATGSGGGVSTEDGAITKIEHNYIAHNTATADGGGLFNFAATTYVKKSAIVRNRSQGSGGGVSNLGGGEVVVEYSKIKKNTTTSFGGGIDTGASSELRLRHTEVNENKAVGLTSQAGGVRSVDSDVTLTNSEVNRNLSTETPGGFLKDGGTVEVDDESEIIKNRPSNCADGGDPVENCFG
jgi:hypothetical protein